jgi:regulator of protease activity HflC (stomatin/prohibitin superfamily)
VNIIGSIFIAFIVLVGGSVGLGSWYTIDQTERGVLLSNGAFQEVVQPGLHFKMPWFSSVYKIDMQTHNYDYAKVNAYSADQQPADLKISVTMHVTPGKESEMYSRFGGDEQAAVARLITPHMNQEVKVVFGKYTAQKAITDRGPLNSEAAKALADAIAYDPIFTIEGVQIEDISFSPEYIKSVEARMQAEVNVQQKQQELQQEKVKAEIAVTQAKGRADSVVAEAKAEADATILKGNADAMAIKAKADALSSNSNLIALTQAEKWNGALPTTMVPGSTVPFISVK